VREKMNQWGAIVHEEGVTPFKHEQHEKISGKMRFIVINAAMDS